MYRSNLYNFIEGGNLNWILYQVEKILLEQINENINDINFVSNSLAMFHGYTNFKILTGVF